MNLKSTVLKHILVWLIFVSYELAYLFFTVGLHASVAHFTIYYGLNILLFYTNSYLVLDFSFFKTRAPYIISCSLILFEMLLYLVVKYALDFLLGKSTYHPIYHTTFWKQYIVTNIWRAIYFIGLSIAFWSTRYMLKFRDINHRMENEQLKSIARNLELENKYISVENAYLQNQISPHLLFNSLAFIYNSIYKFSETAGNGVMRLSELMRYSLVSADDKRTVSLSDEIKQMENLIGLCRLQYNGHFYLRFKRKGKIIGFNIIPLILITVVENMIKHGDLGDAKCTAQISLTVVDRQLIFESSNLKKKTNLYPKGGLGLKNVEKRLKNYYQDRYTLTVEESEDLFIIHLNIEL
jgi:two-component system LytT family sensor kinase